MLVGGFRASGKIECGSQVLSWLLGQESLKEAQECLAGPGHLYTGSRDVEDSHRLSWVQVQAACVTWGKERPICIAGSMCGRGDHLHGALRERAQHTVSACELLASVLAAGCLQGHQVGRSGESGPGKSRDTPMSQSQEGQSSPAYHLDPSHPCPSPWLSLLGFPRQAQGDTGADWGRDNVVHTVMVALPAVPHFSRFGSCCHIVTCSPLCTALG